MSAGWNISLFHYRNHGADYGRVLVGMQVPLGATRPISGAFLDRLGYDLRRRDRQSRLSDVPRVAEPRFARTFAADQRDPPSAPTAAPCRVSGTARLENLPRCCIFAQIRPPQADSGKVYALVSSLGPWQTRRRSQCGRRRSAAGRPRPYEREK